ncbi:MAG: sugar ABC transporter ATP-binding protein [Deltaproteobacteria bacterium]|nr:sugar ABC transporter ATP-binding protein [Deltaproteobacteria bacterium]MBW2121096.1 sugar ABC transporter ATP-binding protein [Deltaproteobacteria bacterium]
MKRTDPILRLKHISKDFGTVRALSRISFDLGGGKILGLVGDNGAGKSTLLRILSGDLQPSSGEIYLGEKPVRFKNPADAMRQGIAIVYQFLQLVDIAKVWENFFMGRELTKRIGPFPFLDIERMKRLTAEAIAKYGHTFDIEREIRELSGGQRQIIAVTRAVEANPDILLLDEPTHGLSKRVIREIFDLLRTAKEEKDTSIIITSQWYEQISDFVDEVMVLRLGETAGRFDTESADRVKIFKLAMGLPT